MSASIETRTVRRLTIDIDAPFDDFRARYEAAAPAYDLQARIPQLSNGDDVIADAGKATSTGFLRYASIEATPVFGIAGHKARSFVYLMGNHTIAERMYRHDPAVMLHAPLRTLLYDGGQGPVLAVDQPSLLFGSYGNPAITAVGVELDGLLAALIDLLGGEVPAELR